MVSPYLAATLTVKEPKYLNMLRKHCSIFFTVSQTQRHDHKCVGQREDFELVQDDMSQAVVERFLLKTSARVDGFCDVKREVVVNEPSIDVEIFEH